MLVYIFLLSLLRCSNANFSAFSDERASRISLSRCIVEASSKFFEVGEMIMVSLTSIEKTPASVIVTDRILLPKLFSKALWTFTVIKPEEHIVDVSRRCDNYIVQIRQAKELRYNLNVLRSFRSWNPHAKFVVITSTVFENETETAAKIAEDLWSFRIVNGIVVLPTPDEITNYNVYSWFPYEHGNCGQNFNKTLVIDSCRNGKFRKNMLWYPKKIPKQLNGCPVRVRVVEWPPYVMQPTYHISGTELYEFNEGIEIELMKTIAAKINLTVIYSMSDNPNDWGNIDSNGTVTGSLLELKERKCDIIMTAMSLQQEWTELFDHTRSYVQESLTWCVPHAKSVPPFQKLSETMRWETWCFVIVSYFTVSVVVCGLSRNEKREYALYKSLIGTLLYAFSVVLAMAVNTQPRTTRVRLFAFLWILTALVLDIEYTTYMISILTGRSYEKQMKTLDDILKSNLKAYVLYSSMKYMNGSSDEMRRLRKRIRICDDMDGCLSDTAYKRNSATCVPRLYQEYVFNKYKNNDKEPLLYCFKESIVSYPVVMYLTKGYPLTERINEVIENVKAAGLMNMWEKRIYENRWFNSTLEHDDDADDPKWMTLSHLQAVFGILMMGEVIAFIVFVGELLWYRWKKRKRRSKIRAEGRRLYPARHREWLN